MSRNRNRNKSRNSGSFPLFRFGLLAAAIVVLAALVLQNLANPVTISFLGFATIPIPLSLAMAIAFVGGAISAYVINVLGFWLGGNRSEPADRSDRSGSFEPPPVDSPSSSGRSSSSSYASDDAYDTRIQGDSEDYQIYYETSDAADDATDDITDATDATSVERSRTTEPPLKSAQPGSRQTKTFNDSYARSSQSDRLDRLDQTADRVSDQVDEWVDGNFYGGRTRYPNAKGDRFAADPQPRSDIQEAEEMVEYPPKQRPEGYDEYYEADQVIKEEPQDYLEAKYIRRGDEEY
jgi:uncharacterized integral membrane protein